MQSARGADCVYNIVNVFFCEPKLKAICNVSNYESSASEKSLDGKIGTALASASITALTGRWRCRCPEATLSLFIARQPASPRDWPNHPPNVIFSMQSALWGQHWWLSNLLAQPTSHTRKGRWTSQKHNAHGNLQNFCHVCRGRNCLGGLMFEGIRMMSGRFQDAIPGIFGALFGAGVLG